MKNEDITPYFKKGLISKIVETELQRYLNFFEQSYKENRDCAEYLTETFPRWSMIAGYYAMHDLTKLFLAKQFLIKVELRVHKTTVELMQIICKDKELLSLLQSGYEEFLKMANDLAEAKQERIKAQYYTGSEFMKGKYKEKAAQFVKEIVRPYLKKLGNLMKEELEETNESKSL